MESSIIDKIITHFGSNRDANATNRGFYYQYLSLLHKWIDSYIQRSDVVIYSEVEEDIKEVGDELVFTQVKSYTNSFSLNSKDVKKALFNFYILFLKYHRDIAGLAFVFQTNSSMKKNEKILSAWVQDPALSDLSLRTQTINKIRETLSKQFKVNRDKVLANTLRSANDKEAVKAAYSNALEQIKDKTLESFLQAIRWEFKHQDPQNEILSLESRIALSLENPIFNSLPPEIIVNRLLSEIYRRSMLNSPNDRKLTIQLLSEILNDSRQNIELYVNEKLINLFDSSYFKIMSSVHVLQEQMTTVMNEVKEVKAQNAGKIAAPPKELTLIPKVYENEVIGRDNEIYALKDLIAKSQIVIVNGNGGLGKSSLIKAYSKIAEEEFDFLMWVDGTNGIRNAFMYNSTLLKNLRITFLPEQKNEDRYEEIVRIIKQLSGKLLIVIDDLTPAQNESARKYIDQLISPNITIIVTSRQRIQSIPSLHVKELSHAAALQLIRTFCPDRSTNEVELTEFLKAIEYNTLMIELGAKTVEASLDLTFSDLNVFLKNNELDSELLNIEIKTQSDGTNTKLVSHLLNTFTLSGLPNPESITLELLSILPSEFYIDDYIKAYGKEFYSVNKTWTVNLFNNLHTKGWVHREGKVVRVHKLAQLAIRHQIKNYVAYGLFINYLCHRLKENNQYFDHNNVAFLLMAQAVLNAINRKDRHGVEQPLIILELNLLESYRQLGDSEKFIQPMINLVAYAEEKLEDNSIDMAVIYNNVAIAYQMLDEGGKAVGYAKRAVDILSLFEEKEYRNLIISIDSLTAMLLQQNKPEEVNPLLKRSLDLRTKYINGDDALFAVQLNNIGAFYLKLNMIDESINALKFAIVIHNSSTKPKNDFFLAMYNCNLSVNYFFKKAYEKSVHHQLEAIKILERTGAPKNDSLLQCYGIMSSIYQGMGHNEIANVYTAKHQAAINGR